MPKAAVGPLKGLRQQSETSSQSVFQGCKGDKGGRTERKEVL